MVDGIDDDDVDMDTNDDCNQYNITCGGGPNVHHNANRNRNRNHNHNHNANVNGNTNQSEAQISPRCVTCPVSDPIHCILCYQLRAYREDVYSCDTGLFEA